MWEGLDRFENMGKNRTMFASEVMLQKIGNTARSKFQYI